MSKMTKTEENSVPEKDDCLGCMLKVQTSISGGAPW